MEDELILSEQDRGKLDGVVSKMIANKEPEANIQFVVNDFKQKYAVKKKEPSEASALQSLAEPSASATSAEVPAAFGEIPKFEGTKKAVKADVEFDAETAVKRATDDPLQRFKDIGALVGGSIAEGVVSANTFLNRAVEGIFLGSNTNYFSSNSAKLLEPLKENKNNLKAAYVGPESANKGIVEAFQEDPAEGAKLLAFEAAYQLPQMLALGAIGRTAMAAEGAAAAGLRTGAILSPRTKLAKIIAEEAAPMVPLGMSAAGQAYLDAAEKNPEEDWIDVITNLAVGTYKGTGEIASELLFRTSVDDLIRGGFKKGLVSDIAKSTRPALQAAKQVGKDVVTEGFQEGIEELAVEISSNSLDALIYGEDMLSKKNIYGMADAFILGSALGSPITLLSKGPSAIGTAKDINRRRKISEEVNDLYDVHQDPTTSASEKAVVKGQIINKLAELKQVENGLASFYEEFSEEDRDNVISLNQQLSMAQLIYPELQNEQSKEALQEQVKKLYSDKTKIEVKYDPNIKVYEYDTQKEAGVPSPVVEGEAPIEVQPIEGASQETPEAGGVLQVPVEEGVEVTAPTAVTDVVSDFIDRRVSYITPSKESVEGFLYDEGAGKLVIEDDRGNKYDIGNVDDVGGISSADLGVSQAITEDFDISPEGNFVIRGQEYVNQYSNPEAAIQRDSDGNVVSVNLETTQGAKRAFRGPIAETIAYNIALAQKAETINEVESAAVELPTSTVIAAPFFNTTVASISEARNLRKTPEYKQQQRIINRQAKLTGVEVIKIDESIGGFENANGEKIVEVSNVIQVRGDRANVDNFAAMLGAMSVETQEATIAADYVKSGSENHNADELTFVVSNIDGAIRALKTQGFYDFTINDSASTITVLDFSLGKDIDFKIKIGNLVAQFKLQKIKYEKEKRRALDSRYIGPETRRGVFEQLQGASVQRGQAGSELRNEVSKAVRRNEEIISFLAEGKPMSESVVEETVVEEDVPEQATEQVEESIGASVKNKRGIDQEDIDKSVGNAFRLLRKAGSDVKIVTFKNTGDYNKAIAENSKSGVDETAIEQGRYLPSRREIYINLEEMDTVTPFHEVFHAIFIDRYTSKGKDQKDTQANRERVAKNFYTQLRGILMEGTANDRVIAESADIFASESGYSINEQPEEFLAQIAGYLSNNGNKISKSTTDKIIQWITNFINKFVPGVKISSRGELIDFMNSFSGAMFELTGKPMAPVINLKSTNDLLDSASRGAFTISYFEDTDQYKKFVDDGLVVNNFNLDQIAGQTVATHQPDNFMVGDVRIGDKLIVEGDGGVYFVLKFGEVWASGRASSASGIAKAINWSRENSTDGKGRMLLARGTTPKLISSTKGVKGGMQIIEEMVDRNLIPRKDFRASLIRVGKKYGIDFSGNDSMTSIKNDIEQKFMKPSDSTFAKRGSFFEDLISDISSTSAASKENIDGIRKFLGSKKRISFSKEGITSAIAELMTERMLIDLPSSHAYAVIEVDNDVKVEKSKKHDSYPYSIVQVDGKRPTLYLLKDRPKAVPSLLTKDGEPATNAKVGFAQMGYGRAIVNPALAAEAQQQNKPIEGLFKESQSKRYKEGLQDSKISNQIEDKISNDPTWKQRERTQFERFIDLSRVKIQDKLFGAIKLQEDIEYAKERPVKLDEDFKNAEVLMHGKAEEDIKKTEELAIDVIKSIKDAGLDLQSFDDLLYAIHAQERNRYLRIQSTDIYNSIKKLREEANLKPSEVAEATGVLVEDYRKIEDGTIERGITNEELVNILSLFGKTPAQFFYENALSKNGSGMKDDQAQMILSAYGLDKYNPDINKLRPDIRDAVKKTYEITNDTRNRMLEFGLETQERIDTYNNTYKNYVPLRGFADDKYDSEIIGNGNGIEVRSKEKRAKGRESKADSPFAQIIAQNQAAIIRGRKNEVANRLYELAKNNPNPEIFEVIDPAVDKNYKKNVTPQGIRLTAETVFDYMKQPENFSVLVNGEYKFIKFADPRIADQLRNASVVKSDFLVKYIGWYSRLLSKLLTQYNPAFIFTNFFRDIQTAIVNSISEQEIEGGLLKGKNITFKIFKSTFPSIKTIFDVEFNRDTNSEYAKYYKEFKEDGGKTGWFYSKSVDELKTDFERLINGKGQGIAKKAESIVERVNSSVENGVRLSAYIESRKAGLSREKAAELAKNLTINFNKSGSLGPSANALYLFFNASVQGTSRLIRTLKPQYRKNDDGSRSLYMTNAQKIMTSVFVFGGVMSIINELISDDDDDGKSFYSKIPEFEKERNIIFMNPDGKTYEKWPLPYGFNIFYVAGNAIGEASQGLKSPATVLSNIFEASVGSFSPINFPSSDEFSNWFFKFILPTSLQIPLAIQMNENYFGQTIYNENFPLDPTPKPDSELGRKGATPWNTAIAKGLNKLTGGSEFRSGFIDINPDTIDFISETVLGGAGRFASRTTSALANVLTGNADKVEINKIPIVSTFYGQPVKYTDLQDYFDKRIEVNQYMEEVRADKITGAEEDRIREMYKVSKAVDGALRNLRKAEKTAENIEDSERRENRLNDLEKKRYAQITNFQKAYEKYKIDKL